MKGICSEFGLTYSVFLVLLSACVAKPAHSASLSLVITTDRQALNGALYSVADTVNFAGSVSNGSALPDALVLFEVDTPKGTPWIIRTFATGQTPTGPWLVQLLSVTPSMPLETHDIHSRQVKMLVSM